MKKEQNSMHEVAQQALDRITLKSDYFVDIQLWPVTSKFDPIGWLDNFEEVDRPFAALLLDSFLYLPENMSDSMFLAAVHSISSRFQDRTRELSTQNWRTFLSNVLFCMVTGEQPSPTDSGYLFARKARQVLRVSEDQVLEPHQSLYTITSGPPCHVIFIDDFVGSGNQFVTMWNREYPTMLGNTSFAEISMSAAFSNISFSYCPILTTATGIEHLARACPRVALHPAHVLDPHMSPLHPDTKVFPDDLRAAGQQMIQRISQKLKIPDTDGSSPSDWQGYRKLACAVAFSHGIPDATLPIFYWDADGWTPLMRRT